MALKAILATLDGLDEALKPLYKKTDDGKYVLEVEGLTDHRSKLEEFRATNRALAEKVEELQKQLEGFKGLDPAKYKELQDKMATLEEKKLGEVLCHGKYRLWKTGKISLRDLSDQRGRALTWEQLKQLDEAD
jgi:hypothetical protein